MSENHNEYLEGKLHNSKTKLERTKKDYEDLKYKYELQKEIILFKKDFYAKEVKEIKLDIESSRI